MERTVDIKKLITASERLINDPQLGFAHSIENTVQEFDVDGKIYELKLIVAPKEKTKDAY